MRIGSLKMFLLPSKRHGCSLQRYSTARVGEEGTKRPGLSAEGTHEPPAAERLQSDETDTSSLLLRGEEQQCTRAAVGAKDSVCTEKRWVQ
jgi:hypothetical protein